MVIDELKIYDYIEYKNCISIIRSLDHDKNKVIVKPLYYFNNSTRIKQKEKSIYIPNNAKVEYLLGKDLLSLSLSDIKIKISPEHFSSSTECSNIIKIIVKTIQSKIGDVYLFGSRLTNHDSLESDWDFLIETDLDISLAYNNLQLALSSIVRKFNQKELTNRFFRYKDNNTYSSTLLFELIKKTTFYTFSEAGEIGFFFIPKGSRSKKSSLPTSNELHHIKGTILESNNKSFEMPREVKIYSTQNRIITVCSCDWIFYGLEMLIKKKIIFQNLLQTSGNIYWFTRGISQVRWEKD